MRNNLAKLCEEFKTWSSAKLNRYLMSMATRINILIDLADAHALEVRELRTMISDTEDDLNVAKKRISDLETHRVIKDLREAKKKKAKK